LGVAAVITMATVLGLTPQQKAALVVVSGLPAPPGVAGVIVQSWNRNAPRPEGPFVVTDQEGGAIRTFPQLPPRLSARAVRSKAEAFVSGRATVRALRRVGVDVDLGPVLDLPTGRSARGSFVPPSSASHLRAGSPRVAQVRAPSTSRASAR
jgi:beta-glucosidase-like glycosyl hydrolase